MKRILFAAALLLISFNHVNGQEVFSEYQGTWRAEVLNILKTEPRIIPGTENSENIQTLSARIIDGPKKGEVVTIKNDFLKLKEGSKFYFSYNIDVGGVHNYNVLSVDRRGPLIFLIAMFSLAVVVFGGFQGLRSLLALAGSFLAVFYILVPGLLGGWHPLIASFSVAAGILFAAIFFTHGLNKESLVAYTGTMIAVILTSVFALIAVKMTGLTGFATDEAVYLDFDTKGALDFTSILLGAIIIGVLGVLDDIAITQAAVVTELYGSNPSLSKLEVYRRAIRIGREHVGALVNTLVLAYTGASLPLLLYFSLSTSTLGSIVNTEIIATEIVRAVVGSLGLILTVPIVTILAVFYLKDYKGGHSHHHGARH